MDDISLKCRESVPFGTAEDLLTLGIDLVCVI
jgi:hypothetical protein